VFSTNLLFFRLLDPEDGGTTVFETLEITHPKTLHYNPVDFKPLLNTKIKK